LIDLLSSKSLRASTVCFSLFPVALLRKISHSFQYLLAFSVFCGFRHFGFLSLFPTLSFSRLASFVFCVSQVTPVIFSSSENSPDSLSVSCQGYQSSSTTRLVFHWSTHGGPGPPGQSLPATLRMLGVRTQAQQGWCFSWRLGKFRGTPFIASQLRYACWA
jgi:hypothetical protein